MGEIDVVDLCDEDDDDPGDEKSFVWQRNVPKKDAREGEGENYRYKVSPEEIEEKVKAMKDYLLTIAKAKPSEDAPLPHLERHQAWLLFGGNQKEYKNLETFDFAAETFSYYIYPDVMSLVDEMFHAKQKPTKGFVPLMAFMDTFLKYDLPDFIPDKCYYVTRVLAYEAVTKIIMDLEHCTYERATGIGLEMEGPTKTTFGLQWERLVQEKQNKQRELAMQRMSRRKQQRPKRVLRPKGKTQK